MLLTRDRVDGTDELLDETREVLLWKAGPAFHDASLLRGQGC